jgi:hypothetical protein
MLHEAPLRSDSPGLQKPDLHPAKPSAFCQPNRVEPKLPAIRLSFHVHVPGFIPVSGIKEEPVRPNPENRRHPNYSTLLEATVPLTFELTGDRQAAKPAVGRPVERGVRRRSFSRVTELHCPCGGCQSSTLLPSGSMTHPNFPYSESSVFSSTLQPSSRSALRSAARSSTR